MSKYGMEDTQDWRKLAEQASREQNPVKLRALVAELCDLLEKQLEHHKSRGISDGL